MNTFTGILRRGVQSVRTRARSLNLKKRFSSASSRGAAFAMTMRIAVLPLVPLTATAVVPSTTDAEPPSTTAVLAVRTAPAQMAADPVAVSVTVGESHTEEVARKQREAAEAAAAAKAAAAANLAEQTDRIVLSRYRDDRTNGGLTLDEARAKTASFAAMYGVDPVLMTKIIACESGYNQFAKNSRSTASGYGQFVASTWRSTANTLGFDESVSPFDGEKNLQAVAYLLSVRGTSPWNSSRSCWAR